MGKFSGFALIVILFGLSGFAQNLDLAAKEDFEDIVTPIITKAEKAIYKSLPDFRARKYFQDIFWYKRNPTPETTSNPYRADYFERRQISREQFAEGRTPGFSSDRGLIFLLLGDPDDVVQNQLPNSGLKPGYEEIWQYEAYNLKLRFIYDGVRPQYRLENKNDLEPMLERIRNMQVIDRAEPYHMRPTQLTLPNLGFTKDIENLVADDKSELDYKLSYTWFKGDLNRTELLTAITFNDASDRGMIIHLAAYDPYDNKVEDFKKRIDPVNGRLETFSVVIEPDQYKLVLRLMDRDGREAIDRRVLDVPRVGPQPSRSGLLAASSLDAIPLEGFRQPKKFVFGDVYFPIKNDYQNFRSDRLYLMQHFYGMEELPELTWHLNFKQINARQEKLIKDQYGLRLVVSIPAGAAGPGLHHIKSVYRNEAGSFTATAMAWELPGQSESRNILVNAATSDKIELVHPSKPNAELLDRVVIKAPNNMDIAKMYVFLNGRLMAEQNTAPWEVFIEDGSFSISGANTLTVVLDTSEGLVRLEKELQPLRADEKIKSRVVRIFFNAFNEKLEFQSQVDFDKLKIEVDGEAQEAREIQKLDEPITYCFMVDTSYSMKDSFEGNLSALRKMIQSIRPQDQGYIVGFDNNYIQYMEPNCSKDVMMAVLNGMSVQRPNAKHSDQLYLENETFLYDAVIAGIHTLHQYPGRKVVILVTDGIGTEGIYRRSGMLSYARENDVVLYSLWLDNNPELSDDEAAFLKKEQGRTEKVFRAIGLSRFFRKKDARKNYIGQKIRKSAINQGAVKILAEESGGFHYRIFRADRTLIKDYVGDIEQAVQNQFVLSLNLPVSMQVREVNVYSEDPEVSIRCRSHVKVRKSNPLTD